MERLYIKILFSFILSLCGFSSLLLIRSNQTSTETVTRVSSAQGIPLKPLSVVSGVHLSAESPAVSDTCWADQSWLPLLGHASVPCCLWDQIEARLGCACSWPKHQYLKLGMGVNTWKPHLCIQCTTPCCSFLLWRDCSHLAHVTAL